MYASAGTYDALKVSLEDRQYPFFHGYVKGPFKCFSANHDAAEPLNFIIDEKILFITDNYKLQFDFSWFKFTCIMIEANYCEELIKGKADDFVNKRRFRSHMSFQTALLTLKTLDLSECKQIILIHLSDGYTDENRFIQDTEKAFGIPTICADKNQVIEL
jgi:phosphoribosyl 1,2-cyclic phosphodiesterase